jgi:hypothetical protein
MSSYVTGGLAKFLKLSSSDPATGQPFRVLDKKQVKQLAFFYFYIVSLVTNEVKGCSEVTVSYFTFKSLLHIF